MSWKLRWAGHNRGKKRIYREDGSYFYDDPSKYPLEEPQYTEEQLKKLEELDKRGKEIEEERRKLQIEKEKLNVRAQQIKELKEFGRANISGKMHYVDELGYIYFFDGDKNKIYIDDF